MHFQRGSKESSPGLHQSTAVLAQPSMAFIEFFCAFLWSQINGSRQELINMCSLFFSFSM